jgi:hypothetical protein
LWSKLEGGRRNPRCHRGAIEIFEHKAFTLFNAYIALSLALFGVGGALIKTQQIGYPAEPFIAAGACFVAGALFLVLTLIDQPYGAIASDPDMWLNKGTIDGSDSTVSLMLAYITFYHRERIAESTKNNNNKACFIRAGIFAGLAAPVVLITVFLWTATRSS